MPRGATWKGTVVERSLAYGTRRTPEQQKEAYRYLRGSWTCLEGALLSVLF